MKAVAVISLCLNALFIAAGGAVIHGKGGFAYVQAAVERRIGTAEAPADTPYRLNKRDIYALAPIPEGALVLLGDSILDLMGARFFKPGEAVNRAVSGDTTGDVLERLPALLERKPRAIALLVGINDLQAGESVETATGNISLILDGIGATGTSVLLLPLLPINEAKYRVHIESRNPGITRPRQTDVEAINASQAEMAGERDHVRFVETDLTDAAGQLADDHTIDGLHLNGSGAQALSDTLRLHLR